MWEPMATAPPDRIVRLAIIDKSGAIYALPHPCRRARDGGWIDATSKEPISVSPSAWEPWWDKP